MEKYRSTPMTGKANTWTNVDNACEKDCAWQSAVPDHGLRHGQQFSDEDSQHKNGVSLPRSRSGFR